MHLAADATVFSDWLLFFRVATLLVLALDNRVKTARTDCILIFFVIEN